MMGRKEQMPGSSRDHVGPLEAIDVDNDIIWEPE